MSEQEMYKFIEDQVRIYKLKNRIYDEEPDSINKLKKLHEHIGMIEFSKQFLENIMKKYQDKEESN